MKNLFLFFFFSFLYFYYSLNSLKFKVYSWVLKISFKYTKIIPLTTKVYDFFIRINNNLPDSDTGLVLSDISKKTIKKSDRIFTQILITNTKCLTGIILFQAIFLKLREYYKENKFNEPVVFITSGITTLGEEYSIHSNFILTKNSVLKDFLSQMSFDIDEFGKKEYLKSGIVILCVKVWEERTVHDLKPIKGFSNNSSWRSQEKVKLPKPTNTRKYSTSVGNGTGGFTNYKNKNNPTDFTPLSRSKTDILLTKKIFLCMDIETMCFEEKVVKTSTASGVALDLKQREQTPVLITCSYKDDNDNLKSFHTLGDSHLLNNRENFLKDLWERFFTQLKKRVNYKVTVFLHNLGNFDGYYILTGLLNMKGVKKDDIKTIIDSDKNYVQITFKGLNFDLVFKDSLRMFDVSLDDLCKHMNVRGKTSKYDEVFNSPTLFKNPLLLNKFIKYGLQDSKALFQVLEILQLNYLNKYQVDICDVWSAATLSLKIFRKNFLTETIPSLNSSLDSFCREAYFGGVTDYFWSKVKEVFYYDVNSLYPAGMCNLMPYKPDKFFYDMKNIKLEDFFGFAYVKVTCPPNIKTPLLPYRKPEGGTIYPIGTWFGTYFSEELKDVVKYGYTVELINGWSFLKKDLFSEYVKHFYDIKKNAVNQSHRWIAKQSLNVLYGYFGRSREKIITKLVSGKECEEMVFKYLVKTVVEIKNDLFMVLFINKNKTQNKNLINNPTLEEYVSSDSKNIKSNVAIAAAVTAYGRILMNNFKTLAGYIIYYTDTDSIFVNKPLPPHMIGDELGQMKNELVSTSKEGKADEAIFLGIKRYSLKYIGKDGNLQYKHVFASIKKNLLTWEDYERMLNGETLTVKMSNTFQHNFTKMTISINERVINVSLGKDKVLTKEGRFSTPHVNITYVSKLVHKINQIRKYLSSYVRNLKYVKKLFTKKDLIPKP